jgi:hypothetical protein
MVRSKRLEARDEGHGGAAMTVRKTDNCFAAIEPPPMSTRETGAAELLISPDTWDQ